MSDHEDYNPDDYFGYELRAYTTPDYFEALKTLHKEHPEMYAVVALILRKQPIHVSEADFELLKKPAKPLVILYPVTIIENKDDEKI